MWCPRPRLFQNNVSFDLSNQRLNLPHSQSGARTHFFGCEKRFENPGLVAVRDPRSLIRNRYRHGFRVMIASSDRYANCPVAPLHSCNGIREQVDDNRLNIFPSQMDLVEVVFDINVQTDSRWARNANKLDKLTHRLRPTERSLILLISSRKL